jgi:nitrate/nitrite transport system substrate-binding protein
LSSVHEKGFFKKYGLDVTIAKGANWAAIRDSLSSGDNQATHMLIGMPIASTMGLLGSPKKPMVIPWMLNRNGQAITLKADLEGQGEGADPKALKPFVEKAKSLGEPLTFAMTFPPGTHAMWMRYYLARVASIRTRTSTLITVPPPQMVANMKIGKMDGFCVGEPWNARTIDGQDRLHLRYDAGHVEGSSREGLRLHWPSTRTRIRRPSRRCSRPFTRPASGSMTWGTVRSNATS